MNARAVARALGGEVTGGQVLAPGPGHSAADRSLSVRLLATASNGFLTHSFAGDDWIACRKHVSARLGMGNGLGDCEQIAPIQRSAAEEEDEARRAAFIRQQFETIVGELVPLSGTPGEQYLREKRRIPAEMPDADQLRRLHDIVAQEYREFRDVPADEFARAFLAVSTFFRTSAPDHTRYVSYFLDVANRRLEARGLGEIGGAAFVCACLAWSDVPWRARDPNVGQMVEFGLGEFSGSRSANNVWRDLLAGERGLMKPTPPDRNIARQEGVRVVRSASEM